MAKLNLPYAEFIAQLQVKQKGLTKDKKVKKVNLKGHIIVIIIIIISLVFDALLELFLSRKNKDSCPSAIQFSETERSIIIIPYLTKKKPTSITSYLVLFSTINTGNGYRLSSLKTCQPCAEHGTQLLPS